MTTRRVGHPKVMSSNLIIRMHLLRCQYLIGPLCPALPMGFTLVGSSPGPNSELRQRATDGTPDCCLPLPTFVCYLRSPLSQGLAG